MKKALGIGVLAVGVTLTCVWWWVDHERPAPAAPRTELQASAAHAPQADEPSPESSPKAASERSRPSSASAAAAQSATRLQDAEAKRLRAAIVAAIQATTAAAEASPPGTPDPAQPEPPERPSVPTLDRSYIRTAVDDIRPLIQECFELGRAEHPDLDHARAIVHFSIIGDEKLGGVIEESRLDDDSEDMTPALSECVRETMYGLKLPAPQGRGRVEVTYPFKMVATPPKPASTPSDVPK